MPTSYDLRHLLIHYDECDEGPHRVNTFQCMIIVVEAAAAGEINLKEEISKFILEDPFLETWHQV